MLRRLALIALIPLLGCDDPSPSPTVPDGYAPVARWGVTHDALTQAPVTGVEQPLQTPIRVLLEGPSSAPDALLVAERTGWRVRRYPVLTAAPLTLGAPTVVVAVTPDTDEVTVVPNRLATGDLVDLFGELMVRLPDGALVVSGPGGRLWLAESGQPHARLLGHPDGGAPAADGVEVADADLNEVAGLGFAPEAAGAPPALLLATGNAVFQSALTRTAQGWATGPLRRVIGTGQPGAPDTGGLARETPLGFEDAKVLLASDGPHLYMTSPGSARLLMVPDFRSDAAPTLVVAGGGVFTSLVDPLEATLSSAPGNALHLVSEGALRRLLLFERGGAVQLELTVPAGDLTTATWDKEAVRERLQPAMGAVAPAGFMDAMSILAVGDAVILGDPIRGVLVAYKRLGLDTRDNDGDGVINAYDRAPDDPNRCDDRDFDGCDDCAVQGRAAPEDDGPDPDGDGRCEANDADGDLIDDAIDRDPTDPNVCLDDDNDGCDDCAVAGGYLPINDGPDADRDGLCDLGDPTDDSDPGRVIAGWGLDAPPDAVAFQDPVLTHPGAVVPYTFRGRERTMVADLGSGWIWTDAGPGLSQPVLRADRAGRVSTAPQFDSAVRRPFQSIAVMPPRPTDETPRLVVSSPLALTMLALEFGDEGLAISSRVAGPGDVIHPVDRAALLSYLPDVAPVLLGDNLQGRFMLLERGEGSLATRSRDDSGTLTPLATLVVIGGDPLAQVLPIDAPESLIITELEHTRDATRTPEDAMMFAIDEPFLGDLALGATLHSVAGDCPMGGRALMAGQAQVIAGGGDLAPSDGAQAAALRLSGLTSAVPMCDGRALLTLAERGRARLALVDAEGIWSWLTPPAPSEEGEGLARAELASPARLTREACLGEGQVIWMGYDGAWWLNLSEAPAATPLGEVPAGGATQLVEGEAVLDAVCHEGEPVLLLEGARLTRLGGAGASALPVVEATDLAVAGGELIVVGRERGGPWQLRRVGGEVGGGAPLAAEVLSGQSTNPLDGRRANFGRFTDELPLYSGHPDGALYVATPDALLRLDRGEQGELTLFTPIEVLWDGPPLGDPEQRPSAFAAEPWDGEGPPSFLLATGGSLIRFVVGRGPVARLVGAGDAPAVPGAEALRAAPESIHALQVGDDGRIWLRWDGYVGYIDDQGRLIAIAGGGERSPRETRAPWEVSLATRSAAHPSLAIGPRGEVVITEPGHGVVLSFEIP